MNEVKKGELLVKDSATMNALNHQLQALLENDRTVRMFLAEAKFEIKNNPKLMQSTMHSLLACVFEAASMGLSVSHVKGQAYLVPFKNNKNGGLLEAQLIIGYRGYETLAYRESHIKIYSECVFKKDKFKYQLGSHPHIDHEPYMGDKNRVISDEFLGAYAIFTYPDGYVLPLFHDRQEIERRRMKSKAKDNGPWVEFYYAMAKKCPITEGGSKFIAHDLSPRLVEMATREELRSVGIEPPPLMLDTGQTVDEAANEITGEDAPLSGTDSSGTGEEGNGGGAETSSSAAAEPPNGNGFKTIEGKLVACAKRGKVHVITIQSEGEEIDFSTFDGQQAREATELVLTPVRVTYTEKASGDRVYRNLVKGAWYERI